MPSHFLGRFRPLLLSLCLAGCSIKTPYLNVQQWPVEKHAMYYSSPSPYRVGVLPLDDQRPANEQKGQRPRGTFLLLWNRRVGDYYTGDHVFGGQVSTGLTEQTVRYLKAANVFAEVVATDPPPQFNPGVSGHVSRLGREQVVDYLLRGELQHFFGSQTQRTSIVLLPLYFVNAMSWEDAKFLPWGKTAIAWTLYDGRTGDITWRRFTETSHTMPKDTDAMSEAAIESFTTAIGQLASDLRELPLSTMQHDDPQQ